MSSLIDSLLAFLFPDRCAGCRQVGSLFCPACRATLAAYPDMQRETFVGLDEVRVGYLFEGPLREAIHQFKYQRQRRLAPPLGALLAAHLAAQPAAVVMPVPLHETRQRERGFNQAEELAREVARTAHLPLVTAGLVRVRATEQQAHLRAHERQTNMRGAFAWRGAAAPARVLLVDDVLTTGATMSACALALRAAGTSAINGIALARSRPK